MNLSTIERRFGAAMLSGVAVGATVIGFLWLMWPAPMGDLSPTLLALLAALGLAGGAFGSLAWLIQTRLDG